MSFNTTSRFCIALSRHVQIDKGRYLQHQYQRHAVLEFQMQCLVVKQLHRQ